MACSCCNASQCGCVRSFELPLVWPHADRRSSITKGGAKQPVLLSSSPQQAAGPPPAADYWWDFGIRGTAKALSLSSLQSISVDWFAGFSRGFLFFHGGGSENFELSNVKIYLLNRIASHLLEFRVYPGLDILHTYVWSGTVQHWPSPGFIHPVCAYQIPRPTCGEGRFRMGCVHVASDVLPSVVVVCAVILFVGALAHVVSQQLQLKICCHATTRTTFMYFRCKYTCCITYMHM